MKKYKVLIGSRSFGKNTPEAIELLENNGCIITPNPGSAPLKENELVDLIQEYDAFITGIDEVTAKVINHGTNIKVISKHGSGYDNIDLDAARLAGIKVVYAPGDIHESVADMTLALLLACGRHITAADRSMKQNKWERFMASELRDKVLGIVGTGRIGLAVAKRANAFGMKIIAYDIYKNEAMAEKYQIKYVTLNELLEESDFVSVHLPLSDKTEKIIGYDELNKMKDSAYLINTARGGVVDEDALCKVLANNKIAGAALDVFSKEPPTNSILPYLPNVIATPHIAGYTVEGLRRTDMETARNTIDVLNGKEVEFSLT